MRWLAVGLAMWLGGCGVFYYSEAERAAGMKSAPELHDSQYTSDEEEEAMALELLLTRGRFDLQCPAADALILERHSAGPATLVGVSGCGQQAQYSRQLRRSTFGFTTENTRWERASGNEPEVVQVSAR